MDRKGPLGGRDSYIADFDGFSDRCRAALAGVSIGLVASGSFNMLVGLAKTMYVEDPDKVLLLDRIVVAAGETSLSSAMSGISFAVEDTYDSYDILNWFGINAPFWDNLNGNDADGLKPYMIGTIAPVNFVRSTGRYHCGRLVLGSIVWTNSDLAASAAVARYFVYGTLLDRSLFLDSV